MKKRVFVAVSQPDVRALVELSVERFGHDAVRTGHADAIVLEPGCAPARSMLRRFRRHLPPIVFLGLESAPSSGLREALADALSA